MTDIDDKEITDIDDSNIIKYMRFYNNTRCILEKVLSEKMGIEISIIAFNYNQEYKRFYGYYKKKGLIASSQQVFHITIQEYYKYI
jgi:hypothetical protein